MKTLKIICLVAGSLVLVLFIVSLVPFSGTRGAIFEKKPFNIRSGSPSGTSLANWNGQEFYTSQEPDHKFLDELKKRFIESGISENYFNNNIKLIYSDVRNKRIDAWFMVKTNSWLDRYNPNFGTSICRDANESNYDVCKYYVTRIHGWVNLNYEGGNENPPIVYSIEGKIWHDDKAVQNENNVPFVEIKNILSSWKAGLISKSCVPISFNRYGVFLSPKMTFEYVVNGENLATLFDPMKYMQARVNLATGEMECHIGQSVIH